MLHTHLCGSITNLAQWLFFRKEEEMTLGGGHVEENIWEELDSGVRDGYEQNVFSVNKLKLLY